MEQLQPGFGERQKTYSAMLDLEAAMIDEGDADDDNFDEVRKWVNDMLADNEPRPHRRDQRL
jgi:hypothetical protein